MPLGDHNFLTAYFDKRILITGAKGYIGSSLLRILKNVQCHITVLVRDEQEFSAFPGAVANFSAITGDITKSVTWAKALVGADYVFHLAANTSAYRADEDPHGDYLQNALPVLQMLEVCRDKKLSPKIVFAGTVTEVGITSEKLVDETFADHPVTIYDIHKLAAEKYLQYYAQQRVVDTVTLRLPNVYGPGPLDGQADRGVLNKLILKALSGDPLTIYGNGKFVRDYIFIDDVVRAFLAAGSKGAALNGGYYIIGSGKGTCFVDVVHLVVDKIAERFNIHSVIKHISPPEQLLSIENRNFEANFTKFSKATGWSPQISLSDGIDRTIESFFVQDKGVDYSAG